MSSSDNELSETVKKLKDDFLAFRETIVSQFEVQPRQINPLSFYCLLLLLSYYSCIDKTT